MDSFCKLFDTKQARQTQKALDYLDGEQLSYVIRQLNDSKCGRTNWQQKGMRARYRNITKRVVEKSAQLFNQSPAEVELWSVGADDANDDKTAMFKDILDKADFHGFCVNLDQVVRLLKTALVLVQYDSYADTFAFDILHRGNAYVMADPVTRQVYKLIYKLDMEVEEWEYFRVWTPEVIELWREKENSHEVTLEKVSTEPNPYGIVPVSVFYDTTLPRTGFWNNVGCDLIDFNDAYNFHLIDMDFAAAWSVNQTLFTNSRLGGGDEYDGSDRS